MPLPDSIAALGRSLQHLHDALEALRLVLADRPATPPNALIEQLETDVDQLRAWFEDAFAVYAGMARSAPERVPEQMRAVQEGVQRIGRLLACELETAHRLGEVIDLGMARSSDWRAWSVSVRGCLTATRRPVWEAVEACSTCWRELAERTIVLAASAK